MLVKRFGKTVNLLVLVLSGALLASCATRPGDNDPEGQAAYDEALDPMEPINRWIFEVNLFLDEMLLKPYSIVYRDAMPQFVQDRIHAAVVNIREPVTFINDIMQGKPDRAGDTAARFLINSTIGIGGTWDVAEMHFEIEGHTEDFGQTLAYHASYPTKPHGGPYMVLPIFGPSNPRDAIGLVADIALDPFTYILPTGGGLTIAGIRAVDTRSKNIDTIDEIQRTSVDFYATVRSLYRQRRDDEVRDGSDTGNLPAPTISIEFDAEPEQTSSLDPSAIGQPTVSVPQ